MPAGVFWTKPRHLPIGLNDPGFIGGGNKIGEVRHKASPPGPFLKTSREPLKYLALTSHTALQLGKLPQTGQLARQVTKSGSGTHFTGMLKT